MSSLRDLQRAMRDHAFDRGGGARAARAIEDVHAFSPLERLGIHRNATLLGLGAAMRAAFPVCVRLVGEEFFDAMARGFLVAQPPKDPRLSRLGQDFPAFVGGYAPAHGLPYLADVARLEVAWTHAFHAADAAPLAPEALLGFPETRIGEVRLTPLPSLRFVASDYPAAAIWRANQADDPPPVDLGAGGEKAVVWRPGDAVRIRTVGAGAFTFLMALAMDEPLANAWAGASAVDPGFEIVSELQALLAARAFTEARLP